MVCCMNILNSSYLRELSEILLSKHKKWLYKLVIICIFYPNGYFI